MHHYIRQEYKQVIQTITQIEVMSLGDSLQKVKFQCTFAIKSIYPKSDSVNYTCRKVNVCDSETVKCPTYIKDRNSNLSRTCWFKTSNPSNCSYSWTSNLFEYCCEICFVLFSIKKILFVSISCNLFHSPQTREPFWSSWISILVLHSEYS